MKTIYVSAVSSAEGFSLLTGTILSNSVTNCHEPNWEVVQDDVLLSVDQQDPGVTDVHSASNGTATDGTAYSSW